MLVTLAAIQRASPCQQPGYHPKDFTMPEPSKHMRPLSWVILLCMQLLSLNVGSNFGFVLLVLTERVFQPSAAGLPKTFEMRMNLAVMRLGMLLAF